MNAIKRKRIEAGYRYLKLAGIVFVITLAGAILASCKTTVYNDGDNTTLEMSPARNIYPNTSVMNGLSLIPGNDKESAEDTNAAPQGTNPVTVSASAGTTPAASEDVKTP